MKLAIIVGIKLSPWEACLVSLCVLSRTSTLCEVVSLHSRERLQGALQVLHSLPHAIARELALEELGTW